MIATMESNWSLRDNPEQDVLRDAFRSSRLSFAYESRACEVCCPNWHAEGKSLKGWERGNTTHPQDGELGALKCNNCGFIKTFTLRKKIGKRTTPTPAQQRVIDRIKRYFDGTRFGHKEVLLEEFKVEATDYGGWWVTVKTEGNVWTRDGGFFFVGNQGSGYCATAYNLCSDSKKHIAHLNYMIFNTPIPAGLKYETPRK